MGELGGEGLQGGLLVEAAYQGVKPGSMEATMESLGPWGMSRAPENSVWDAADQ